MKLYKFALGVVALAVSASSLAGMVTTSSNLEFLAINGQKASKSLLKEKKSFNAEADQTQQVVVRLGEIVGTGSSQGPSKVRLMMLWYLQKKFVLKKMAKNLMHNHKLPLKLNQVM